MQLSEVFGLEAIDHIQHIERFSLQAIVVIVSFGEKKIMCWVQISKTDLLTIFTFVSVKLVRRLSQIFVRMIVWIDRLSYLSITQFTSDLDHSPYPGILNRTRFASAGITCRRHISVSCYKTKNIFQTFCDV